MIARIWLVLVAMTLSCSVVGGETNTLTNTVTSSSTNSVTKSLTNAPVKSDFASFRVIAERNIFNPNRTVRGSRDGRNSETQKSTRSESFALVGTMLYGNGDYAFFDSSGSSYRKVVKPGDAIAGYKVTEVTPKGVKLEANGKTLEVAVGQQMRRQDEGNWTVSGEVVAEKTDTSVASETTGSSSASSADEDEIVKRLMKKREEESKK